MDEVDQEKMPRIVAGIPLRKPFPSELDFFRNNPNISGYAAEDNAVVLNPFVALSASEFEAVALNEAARIFMRLNRSLCPTFELTRAQADAFSTYGPIESIKETIAARILSGDPSALDPTSDQVEFVCRLAEKMKVSYRRPTDVGRNPLLEND